MYAKMPGCIQQESLNTPEKLKEDSTKGQLFKLTIKEYSAIFHPEKTQEKFY